ncbi:ankyrin repeat domain-containing protein [Candidatus Babela massiliensis]|uniref:Ankyrin repeats containing protein n=1 Tax=Candidatus Babela massiliensis TaxID=673862 RepID=V6DHH5_9BACT|nr:ankyrin repeat domain-containing protein [Candidatus Babela massiliensis]CDK31042.1 Ankyrin repeats containing protein [Candidatus Babela massiliensis]
MKNIKYISLILLGFLFSEILAMQKVVVNKSCDMLEQPDEILLLCLRMFIDSRIDRYKDIFEFYNDKYNLSQDLKSISLTCSRLNRLVQDRLLKDILQRTVKERYNELYQVLRKQVKEEYSNKKTKFLNRKMNNILRKKVITYQDLKECIKIVFCGVDINKKYNHGYTLLRIAASNGHKGIVQFCIDLGANVNIEDHCGINSLISTLNYLSAIDSRVIRCRKNIRRDLLDIILIFINNPNVNLDYVFYNFRLGLTNLRTVALNKGYHEIVESIDNRNHIFKSKKLIKIL